MRNYKISIFSLFFLCFIFTGCNSESENNAFSDFESATTEETILASSVNAYSSIEKAQNAIGFAFMAPTNTPTGYTQDEISVINDNNSKIAQIDYINEDYHLTYRVSQTTEALNSDRNTYEKEKVIIVGNREITCLCNNQDIVFVATWQESGCNYCIMSDQGLDTTTISAMIVSVQ